MMYGKPFVCKALVVSVCVASAVGEWPPCSSTSTQCCNPHTSPSQYCSNGAQCQECGGGAACECPSGPLPTPAPSPTPSLQCNMSEASRTDCGFSGVTQKQCEDAACCWKPTQDPTNPHHYPWCFHSGSLAPTTTPAPAPTPTPGPTPSPGPCPGPTPDNPLGICPLPKRSDNFFLIIGDWGNGGGIVPQYCQTRVAQMMKDYVQKYKAQGQKCLFVGAVGDNFYGYGLRGDAFWAPMWSDIYGTNNLSSPLYDVPFLAVMGNHDYGKDDPYCACGKGTCKQFNGPHRPVGTEKYWLPEYNWHYYVPGVDLEILGLDFNAVDVGGLGGNGCDWGASTTCQVCGGESNIQNFLNGKKAAGESLLDARASNTTAKTTLIMQHYDGSYGQTLRTRYQAKAATSPSKSYETYVLSAYGHAHDQTCQGDRTRGCDVILTGGGGGWSGGSYFGFTAVHLTDDGNYLTVLETDEVRYQQHECESSDPLETMV